MEKTLEAPKTPPRCTSYSRLFSIVDYFSMRPRMPPQADRSSIGSIGSLPAWSNRGKSPGTQVQHTLEIGMRGTEFRHFWAFDCGTVWTITKSARGFAPVTAHPRKPLKSHKSQSGAA